MPKILINEKDRTSPGTPDNYSNFAVLVVGFPGAAYASVVNAVNDVYEFTSAQEFEDTIGLRAPKITVQASNSTIYHYGNQMAYELLNLGYKVIYRVINSIDELTEASFWEIFKDKSSYDFRFITHGMLSSVELSPNQQILANRFVDVRAAMAKLEEITATAMQEVSSQSTNYDMELVDKQNALYSEAMFDYPGFLRFDPVTKTHSEDTRYASFYGDEVDAIGAILGTAEEEAYIKSMLAGTITELTINEVNGLIANLAAYVSDASENLRGRGDCVALIELDETSYSAGANANKPELGIISAINRMSQINGNNGKYCAMTVPSVVYKMADNPMFDNNKKFPGAFHYLACFANSLQSGFAEWYAAAGYTRGVSSYLIDQTTVKLGEIAINALEPRNVVNQNSDPKFACNVIANFRGSYYLWGNRTAHALGSANGNNGDLVASHFLNIRQLCITVKKQLYVACRRFTFDPNSDTLWVNFVNAIKPTLELMKADQGIRDFRIQKVYTDKKATLKAKIRIIPIEAVEDFDLEISLEDSFGETAAVVTE